MAQAVSVFSWCYSPLGAPCGGGGASSLIMCYFLHYFLVLFNFIPCVQIVSGFALPARDEATDLAQDTFVSVCNIVYVPVVALFSCTDMKTTRAGYVIIRCESMMTRFCSVSPNVKTDSQPSSQLLFLGGGGGVVCHIL